MSKILPIKQSLDDRYINQDEKITEQALTQLIDNQGGGTSDGGNLIDCSVVNWPSSYSAYGTSINSKAEVCSAIGITEEQLNGLINGTLYSNLLIHHDSAGSESVAYYMARTLTSGKTGERTRIEWDMAFMSGYGGDLQISHSRLGVEQVLPGDSFQVFGTYVEIT